LLAPGGAAMAGAWARITNERIGEMARKLRTLGLVFVATVAMSAMAASAAQGSQFHTKGAAYPAAITGNEVGEQIFKVHVAAGNNNEIKCKKVAFTGTLAAASSTLTLHPVYQECTAFGLNAVVNTEGCNYVIHSEAELALDEFAGSMDIECGAGQFVNVVTATCELHITPQNGLKALTLVDSTAAGNIIPEFNLAGFAYSITKDGIGCPLTAVENRVDGTHKGAVSKWSAKVGGVATQFTVE